MVGRTSDWKEELGRFLKPFLARLGHRARRRMCPLYVPGLIGPGDRKSIQPMAERPAVGEYDQLHHFIPAGVWDATPLETELLVQADRLVGGSDAVLGIDDTAMPKKGVHSGGVAAQYASALGKTANCQTLVSLTLARGEVPVMLALRLFLPESWTSKRARLERAGVPAEYRTARTKPEMALSEIDRAIAAGVASALGKTANCQTLVSLTLARGEVPVMLALRLFLPESWTSKRARLERAGVPAEYRTARTKPEMALSEIDRAIVRFGCVLADAGYGLSAPFRQGLTDLQTCLGSRYSAAPQGVPCRCADDLAGCQARSSPSAARS